MRVVFSLMFGVVAACASLPAAAQALEPGCRPTPPADVQAKASDLNYAVTETAGLNVVMMNVYGQTVLSDKTCWPDPEQGLLSVALAYGAGSKKTPEEDARESISTRHMLAHTTTRPADFPPTTVTKYDVNGMAGAEGVSHDTLKQGVKVFRYALVFAFPDGAKGVVSASGPDGQFETLRPKLRSIAAGIQPRRNAKEMQQDLSDALGAALANLRGPIVDKALDACLTGAFTSNATIARATAAGFPAFETQQMSGSRVVRSSQAPKDDAGKVTLGVMETPSTLKSGKQSVACMIAASPPFDDMFRERFEARFSGKGTQRDFVISNNKLAPAGAPVGPGPGNGVGRARLLTNATAAQIAVEVTPLN